MRYVFACANVGNTLCRVLTGSRSENFRRSYARRCWLCNTGMWLMFVWGDAKRTGSLRHEGPVLKSHLLSSEAFGVSSIIDRLKMEIKLDEPVSRSYLVCFFPSMSDRFWSITMCSLRHFHRFENCVMCEGPSSERSCPVVACMPVSGRCWEELEVRERP